MCGILGAYNVAAVDDRCIAAMSEAIAHRGPDATGTWKTQVSLLPGTYEYRFVVDGEWRDDPECPLRVENPFATQNCVRIV